MNERIRKLAEQAGIVPGIMGLNRFTHFDPEKFAQLIVQECARVAVYKDDGMISTADVAGYITAGRLAAARMIKQHFGVEE